MIFPIEEPLVRGRLVRRYKRFLADVELDDHTVRTVHCANSGSMLGLDTPGIDVMVRHVPDPRRKLAYTLELVRPAGQAWVGVDTMRPNRIVAAAVRAGLVPGVDPQAPLRSEVRYGQRSRIDLLAGDHHIEVKNTTLARAADAPPGRAFGSAKAVREGYPVGQGDGPHVATFPDAVTARGTKHMQELARLAAAGVPATVVFFVNRGDCDRFEVAADVDATYGEALVTAVDAGVQVVPLGMDVSPAGWSVRGVLPFTI